MNVKITISHDKRNKSSPYTVRWFGEEINPKTGFTYRYCKSFRTKAEARQFASDKRTEAKRGLSLDKPKDVTIGSYRRQFLHDKRPDVRIATLECYENTFDRLEAFFGRNCPMRKITTARARSFIAEQQNLIIPGKNLSDWSRDQIKRNCKYIFKTAVEDRILIANPFEPIRSKKLDNRRWYRLRYDEYLDLLDEGDLRTKVSYALLYTAGLRLSEAFNLIWSDVNFGSGKLIIDNREGTKNIPPFKIKDHESRRVPLTEDTMRLLTKWQTEAPEGVPFILLTQGRYKRVKARWHRLQKEGKPWRNRWMINNVLRNFKNHYRRAGIKPVGSLTIHTLRKSCCQNWADFLPMNVVRELMGHSSISTTAKFYNQLDSDHEARAARIIQQRIEAARTRRECTYDATYKRNLSEKGAK